MTEPKSKAQGEERMRECLRNIYEGDQPGPDHPNTTELSALIMFGYAVWKEGSPGMPKLTELGMQFLSNVPAVQLEAARDECARFRALYEATLWNTDVGAVPHDVKVAVKSETGHVDQGMFHGGRWWCGFTPVAWAPLPGAARVGLTTTPDLSALLALEQCPACKGTGEVYEHHEAGAVETLGCHDCWGIGYLGDVGAAIDLARKGAQPAPTATGPRYVLMLNDMRAPKIELLTPVKVGTREELDAYMEGERVEGYRDGQWGKVFRKGGPLEWFNEPYEHHSHQHYVEAGQ